MSLVLASIWFEVTSAARAFSFFVFAVKARCKYICIDAYPEKLIYYYLYLGIVQFFLDGVIRKLSHKLLQRIVQIFRFL